jgi:hypothetical protein
MPATAAIAKKMDGTAAILTVTVIRKCALRGL